MDTDFRTYYEILEVSELATPEEIKSAYRRLAREYHEDGLRGTRKRIIQEAEEALKKVNEANAVLEEPCLRAAYDAGLRPAAAETGSSNLETYHKIIQEAEERLKKLNEAKAVDEAKAVQDEVRQLRAAYDAGPRPAAAATGSGNLHTHYDILEVSELATTEEIKNAYDRLVSEYHPHGLPEDRKRLIQEAELRLKDIEKAYTDLADPKRRAVYDAKVRVERARAIAAPPSPFGSTSSSPAAAPSQPDPSSSVTSPVAGAPVARRAWSFHAWVVAALAGSAVIGLIAYALTEASRRQPGPADPTKALTAPEQIVERGICPYEGCSYGLRWRVLQEVDAYADPPTTMGLPRSSLVRVATLLPGSWVRTQTGVVLAPRTSGQVHLIKGLSPYGNAPTGAPPLRDGQLVDLYTYRGEGCWSAWIDGHLFQLCSVTASRKPQNEWWVNVTTPTGESGWVDSASKAFVGEETLNAQLAARIAEDGIALPDKLKSVDALIKNGADLNGSGGRYGKDPASAAITQNDVDLLEALILKGLDIRNTRQCLAYSLTQGSALRAGGDTTLEFLLTNGLRLDCLTVPPLQSILGFGINGDQYPIEQAVRTAQVLLRHGASTTQRDSAGRLMREVLEQSKNATRMQPLLELFGKS